MKLSYFLDLRSLLVTCMICSAIFSSRAQTTENMQHDTIKARTYFELGMALRDDLKSDSSEFYFEQAGRLFELNSLWSKAIKAYLEHFKVLSKKEKIKKSLEYLNLCIQISRSKLKVDSKLIGEVYFSKAGKLISLGNYDSAEFYLRKSLTILSPVASEKDLKIARINYLFGWLYMLRKELDKASKFIDKSLEVYYSEETYYHLANTYNVLALINYYRADYAVAMDYWQKSLSYVDIDNLTPNDTEIGIVYSVIKNSGAAAFQVGNYKKAIENYSKALEWELSFYDEENIFIASSYFNLAEVFDKQGKYDKATVCFLKSLRNYQKALGDRHPDVIEIYEKLGNIYWNQGNRHKALINYNQALRLSQVIAGRPEFRASLYKQLGSAHLEMESFDSSEFYFTRSSAILHELFGQRHPEIADIYLKLALLEKSQGRWEQTLKQCQKALNSVVNNKNSDTLNSEIIPFTTKGIDVLSTYAQYLTDAYLENYGEIGNLKMALSYIELAIELIQQKRILVFDQHAQRDFSQRYAPVYEEGLRIALLLNEKTSEKLYLESAFQMMEGSKAFTLNQSAQDREEPIVYTLPDSLLEKERSLKVDISFYEEEVLNRKSNRAGYDTALVKNYEDKLFHRKRDFDLLKGQLEEQYPKYHQLKYQLNTLSLSELQQTLSEEELLIEFLWQEDRVTIISVTDQEVVYEEIPVDQALLDQLASLNTAFNSPESTLLIDEFSELSHAVFEKLVEPALSITKTKLTKLIVVADGPLTQLNFDLLVQDQSGSDVEWKNLPYLIKDYAIATGHSATLFFDEKSHVHHAPNDLLAFSFGEEGESMDGAHLTMDVVRSADLTSLPGSAREIKTIADLLDGDYYFGQEANEQTFKEVASDYQILHLALHGSVDEENPDFSKLHLHSKDTTEDGQLHVFELYNMELNADLAVLSACNTGSGKYQMGEGIMSLGHAFSYAGVNSLLLTRWDLSDEAAPEIMSIFYSELKKGKSKSEALRIAKLEYLENASIFRSNPFYWSSFYVLGNDSPVEFEKSNGLIYALAGGFVLFLLAFTFSRRRILT